MKTKVEAYYLLSYEIIKAVSAHLLLKKPYPSPSCFFLSIMTNLPMKRIISNGSCGTLSWWIIADVFQFFVYSLESHLPSALYWSESQLTKKRFTKSLILKQSKIDELRARWPKSTYKITLSPLQATS